MPGSLLQFSEPQMLATPRFLLETGFSNCEHSSPALGLGNISATTFTLRPPKWPVLRLPNWIRRSVSNTASPLQVCPHCSPLLLEDHRGPSFQLRVEGVFSLPLSPYYGAQRCSYNLYPVWEPRNSSAFEMLVCFHFSPREFASRWATQLWPLPPPPPPPPCLRARGRLHHGLVPFSVRRLILSGSLVALSQASEP